MIDFNDWIIYNTSNIYWYINYYNNTIYIAKIDIGDFNKVIYFKNNEKFNVTNIFFDKKLIGKNFIIENALYHNDCYFFINNGQKPDSNLDINEFINYCKIKNIDIDNILTDYKKILYNNIK